jgi:enoyl-[acyl-carrier protein] reductase I
MHLRGKRGLILGLANDASIAWGCARAMHALGAELMVTYLNDKVKPNVLPLVEQLGSAVAMSCDVQKPGELEAVFEAIHARWGSLDFVLHAVAYAPKEDLHAPLLQASAAGFAMAMDVSCHSFVRVARLARPMMPRGGTLLTTSYYGAQKVITHYNLMGPVKAALEAVVRQLAVDLGPLHIRVHAISPGPILTRAASGIDEFDTLLEQVARRSPEHQLVSIDEVGAVAAGLVSDWARGMTGNIVFVDEGYHIMG